MVLPASERIRIVEKLREIYKLELTNPSHACAEYGSLLENTLRDLYWVVIRQSRPPEKRQLLEIEARIAHNESLDKVPLGGWIALYEEGRIPEMLERKLGIPEEAFDPTALAQIRDMRNACLHKEYVPTADDVRSIHENMTRLLTQAKLLKEEPKVYASSTPQIDVRIQALEEATYKLRLALSNSPNLVDYEESIEGEEGVWYYPIVVWRFAGAFMAEGKIHLLVYEKEAIVPDDVQQRVYDEAAEKLEKALRKAAGRILDADIEVHIGDGCNFESGMSWDIKM